MPQVSANGIAIEYESHGDPAAEPLLLVMGLGGQLTLWPIELVEALVARGYHVIRYDNRDVGLSQRFDAAGVPNIPRTVLKAMFGLRPRTAYSLGDMAGDAVGLLDALGIASAHVVGASMGGMISQLLAVHHPGRVRTLTSIMSTTGNRRLPRARREAMKVLTGRPMSSSLPDAIDYGVKVARTIGSPAYPAEETRLRERIERDYRRGYYPPGIARQMAAIIADGDRRKRLKAITAPTLMIHGQDDPLVPIAGGRDIAAHIAGARLHEIPGMGHDLPIELVDTIADLIAGHARQTQEQTS